MSSSSILPSGFSRSSTPSTLGKTLGNVSSSGFNALDGFGLSMAPPNTFMSERFIALHIIWVSMRPDAPTIAPIATSRGSEIVKPTIAPASPENELSREIVIGISAPPTRMAKSTPYARDSATTSSENGITAVSTNSVAMLKTAIATMLPFDNRLCPVRWTGLCVMRLSSLAAAIKLPLRVSPPTMRASWLVSLLNVAISPYLSMISAIATRAEAPPPKPLSRATICGICIMVAFTAIK